MNSRKNGLKLGLNSAVSRRNFNFSTDARIEALKQIRLKKRSEKKMYWGVNAYNEWREERLRTFNYDYAIYMADLKNLETLEKENFEYAMVRFIPEVTKSKGKGPYPGRTLYQLCTSIQKYLNVNKIPWKIVKGNELEDVKIVLDNVMKERAVKNIGMVKKQANVIMYEYENELWSKGLLGESDPDTLHNTVLFLIGINCILRAGDEHYYLRRDMPDKDSQLQFKVNSKGQRCLVYTEDTVTKANDGGLKNMKSDRKIVWVCPSSDVTRCPVRLVEKYIKLCPDNYFQKPNFYLQSLQKPTPSKWYASQVVGQNTLGKVIKTMLHDARIDGYFTGHSLRRSGTTRLFQAGVERKIIKEITGHKSDAVDCYAITSDEQKQQISEIIAKEPSIEENVPKSVETSNVKSPSLCVDHDGEKSNYNLNASNVGEMITNILDKTTSKGKTVIKLEIEITHD